MVEVHPPSSKLGKSTSPDLVDTVLQTILDNDLLAAGDPLVIGVSGGPDSVCLLHAMLQLRPRLPLRLHVAHLNHGLRGLESDADAAFVADLAADWDLPATIERFDVPALARARHIATEEAARCARYAFLARTAAQVGAAHIAVAHNADDQTETVLMHWLRGAGLSGMRGMLPATRLADYRLLQAEATSTPEPNARDLQADRSCPETLLLVRPLLRVPRADVEAYCQFHQLKPRQDRSNLDTTYFRNRLRHELIPQLETYNPNIRMVIRRAAEVAAGDYDLVRRELARAWPDVVSVESPHAIRLDRDAWLDLPLGLKRSVLREVIHRLRHPLRNIDFVHVENALEVAEHGETGAQSTLPQGLLLTVGYSALEIGDAGEVTLPDIPLLYGTQVLPVRIPGETLLPGTGWALLAEPVACPGLPLSPRLPTNPAEREWDVVVDGDILGDAPYLRRRHTGDRFCPLGLSGHSKRLNEFLINEKVPAAWREFLPILVDTEDAIVWVAGWRIDHRARVTSSSHHCLRLRFVHT